MPAILAWLGSFLSGPLLKGALDAYRAKLANDNNADQRTADLMARELAVEQREAEVNAQVVVAEQGHWYTACIRPLFAAPFIIFIAKAVVWDKVWPGGHTDDLSPQLWDVAKIVLSAYFAGRSLEKAAAILKRK